MFWLMVGAACAFLFYFFCVRPFNYWNVRQVPNNNLIRTWIETFFDFIQYKNTAIRVQEIYNEFPGVRYSGAFQFSKPILVLRDPDVIKQIAVKDFDHFVDHFNFMPNTGESLWEKNLFILKGTEWRNMRTTLSPSFTGSKMKIMFGLMSDCAQQFVRHFDEQKEQIIVAEMKDIFTRFANDVIATTAFGVTCDSMKDKNNEFYLMGKKATTFGGGFWANVNLIMLALFPRFSKIFGLNFIPADVTNFFNNVIKTNIRSREEQGIYRPDMLQLLLEARKDKQQDLSDDDIAAQAFIFFLAGFDSVATLMYFMAYELALNPDIQNKLHDEVDDILHLSEPFTYETLSKMKYMEMVMSETLRKWPNAIVLDRTCVKPYTIEPKQPGEVPLQLKEGEIIWMPIFGYHRDPQHFPEPERFDPERFSDENKSKINSYLYMPFGAGPRICIASRFALMEAKLVFFYMLSKFQFTVIERTAIPIKLSRGVFQLDSQTGFWLGIKRRQ